MLSFLHEVGILHGILGKGNLLVGFFVHEVESVFVAIKELVRTTLHIDGLDFCTRGEGVFEDAAILEVA